MLSTFIHTIESLPVEQSKETSYKVNRTFSSFIPLNLAVLKTTISSIFKQTVQINEHTPFTDTFDIDIAKTDAKIFINNKVYNHPVIYILTFVIGKAYNDKTNTTSNLVYSIPFIALFNNMNMTFAALHMKHKLHVYDNENEQVYHYMFNLKSFYKKRNFQAKTSLLNTLFLQQIYRKYMFELLALENIQ